MSSRRQRLRWQIAALGAALLLFGCAPARPYGTPEAREKGRELVHATREAGVAPGLTVDVAVSLYGTKAPAVCAAFADGLSSAEGLVLLGNQAQGRRKTITDRALIYSRLVVLTYCPELVVDYDESVRDVNPFDT